MHLDLVFYTRLSSNYAIPMFGVLSSYVYALGRRERVERKRREKNKIKLKTLKPQNSIPVKVSLQIFLLNSSSFRTKKDKENQKFTNYFLIQVSNRIDKIHPSNIKFWTWLILRERWTHWFMILMYWISERNRKLWREKNPSNEWEKFQWINA